MNYDIEKILEEWNKDSKINSNRLDQSLIDIVLLHTKYLDMLTRTKLKLKKQESDYKQLEAKKWLWYNGKMTKQEIDNLGWGHDPMKGLKVMKSDMDNFYRLDQDLVNEKLKIDYTRTVLETLDEIMTSLRWRHSHIKNIIDWRRFEAGG